MRRTKRFQGGSQCWVNPTLALGLGFKSWKSSFGRKMKKKKKKKDAQGGVASKSKGREMGKHVVFRDPSASSQGCHLIGRGLGAGMVADFLM